MAVDLKLPSPEVFLAVANNFFAMEGLSEPLPLAAGHVSATAPNAEVEELAPDPAPAIEL